MEGILTKIKNKFYFKNWTIGICRSSLEELIRNKSFDPEITWLFTDQFDRYLADPFLIPSDNGSFKIMLEEFSYEADYGTLALLKIDGNYKPVSYKALLDTGSHLSYPLTYSEGGKTYMFPEAGKSGKFSCYEYDPVSESVKYLTDIIELPLRDATILKKDNKYWIFATINQGEANYNLLVFYSGNLLGPYLPHQQNPIKTGLDGNRAAGHFFEIEGIIYRPTQNCKNIYGESITINKVVELNESSVIEEPYMNIIINNKNKRNAGFQTIHTINALGDYIVVDGIKWTFAPILQLKSYFRNRRIWKNRKRLNKS